MYRRNKHGSYHVEVYLRYAILLPCSEYGPIRLAIIEAPTAGSGERVRRADSSPTEPKPWVCWGVIWGLCMLTWPVEFMAVVGSA